MEQINNKLKNFIESIESIKEEIKDRNAQIKDLFDEAKRNGFQPKAMKEVLRKRSMEADQRTELELLEETYKEALGMTK